MRYKNTLLVCTYVFCLLGGSQTQRAERNSYVQGSNCRINDAKQSPGVCKNIKECTSALANLRAGVLPTRCQGRNSATFCCPTGTRISAKKCKDYTEVLKVVDGPFPLLPPDFWETDVEEEIHCNPNHNPLISGGRESKAEEFPFAVALGYNTSDTPWRCGGTLISDEYVLTAAHCVDTRLGKPTKLLLGDIYLNSQTSSTTRTMRGVANIIKHPDYQPPMSYNDVALIQMDKKVEVSRSILPACLPQPELDLLKHFNNNLTLTAVGWGYLGPAEKQSEILQAVNLKGFGPKACDKYYAEIIERNIKLPKGIHNSQLCAGDNTTEKDTCQGDSGGGLLLSDKEKRCIFYVAGITSFGPRFCGYRTPAVYTNVISYLEWIESVVWPNQ